MAMRRVGLVVAAVMAGLAGPVRAQDTGFGDQGFAFADFADLLHDFSTAEAVAVQGDGHGHRRGTSGE